MDRRHFILIAAQGLLATAATAQEKSFLQKLGLKSSSTSALNESTIRDGLKEALATGIARAVELAGKNDGYFKNDKIKIPAPKSIQRIDKPLRLAGYGPQFDEFILSMNRAAEKAAPIAKDIFVKAISEMSITDAKQVLHAGDTAATDYLNTHTREGLTTAFLPPVKETMGQYDVMKKYDAVTKQASSLPFAKSIGSDSIEKYTVGKALDGLFYLLGEEEKRIRKDPAARATDLLKKVFK